MHKDRIVLVDGGGQLFQRNPLKKSKRGCIYADWLAATVPVGRAFARDSGVTLDGIVELQVRNKGTNLARKPRRTTGVAGV